MMTTRELLESSKTAAAREGTAPVLFQVARMERRSSGWTLGGWTLGAWKLRAEHLWPMQMVPDGGAA
jgi:hypothetical protein